MTRACPDCGHETEEAVCPLCGSDVPGAAAAGGEGEGARRAGPAPPEESSAASTGGRSDDEAPGPGGRSPAPDGGVAWEDPSVPFPEDLIGTLRRSLFSPSDFFGDVDERGSIARPLLYYLLLTVAGAVFTLLWQYGLGGDGSFLPAGPDGGEVVFGPAFAFFFTPFVALIALAFSTGVYHLGALAVAPQRRGVGATARVVCYAAGPTVLSIVPFVGSVAGAVWTIVLQVVGLREVHRTTTGRALVMVFWAWVVLILLFTGLLALAVMSGALDGAGAGLARVGPAGPASLLLP